MPDDQTLTARFEEVLARHRQREGALLPILHDLQEEFGYIPETCLNPLAQALNISKAELWGVITFYHDFRQSPGPRHSLKLCRAEACKAMGADRLADQAKAALGADWHESNAEGSIALEPVYCLGLCACAPAAMVDGQPIARLTAEKLSQIIEGLRQ